MKKLILLVLMATFASALTFAQSRMISGQLFDKETGEAVIQATVQLFLAADSAFVGGTVSDIKGQCGSFLVVRPWTQFFKPEDRKDMPLSQCNNIVMRNIDMKCKNFFDVGTSDKYRLVDFTFENINVEDEKNAFDKTMIENTTVRNVIINGTPR